MSELTALTPNMFLGDKAEDYLRNDSVFARHFGMTNVNLREKALGYGDTYKVTFLDSASIGADAGSVTYDPATGLFSGMSRPKLVERLIEINQILPFKFNVPVTDSMAGEKFLRAYVAELAEWVIAYDATVKATVDAAIPAENLVGSDTVGGGVELTVENSLEFVLDAMATMKLANIPVENQIMIASPTEINKLVLAKLVIQDPSFVNIKGYAGSVNDLPIYSNNTNVGTVNNAVYFGDRTVVPNVTQVNEVETFVDHEVSGPIVRGLNVFGIDVIHPERLWKTWVARGANVAS